MAGLKELEPDELAEACRVLQTLLKYCGGSRSILGGFDRDELGIDPEDDFEEE